MASTHARDRVGCNAGLRCITRRDNGASVHLAHIDDDRIAGEPRGESEACVVLADVRVGVAWFAFRDTRVRVCGLQIQRVERSITSAVSELNVVVASTPTAAKSSRN